MKIAFFASNCIPIHAKSLLERPVGGTETGIIRMAEGLQEIGHEVTVFTTHQNPPESKPRYLPLAQVETHPPVDVFISIRDWIPLFYQIQSKFRFLWTGDSYDQMANFGIGDQRVQSRFDRLLCVSDWQAQKLCQASGLPKEKTFVLGNGIHLPYFDKKIEKKRKRLIYSSTPYRGLEYIPFYYPELKKAHPDLELHIFSGYEIYDQTNPNFKALRESLTKLEGCTVHKNILQDQLAEEFLKSSILFYPCHFEETSCITAMEAMAAGCVPVTFDLGALRETIGEAGILIPGTPRDTSAIEAYLRATHQLLANDDDFKKLSKAGQTRSKSLSWSDRAHQLLKLVSELEIKNK